MIIGDQASLTVSAWIREAYERHHAKLAREQCGELFAAPPTAAERAMIARLLRRPHTALKEAA